MTDKESGESCGLLFKPLDVDDLEDKVIKLWNNKALADELGSKAENNYKNRFLRERVNTLWSNTLHKIAEDREQTSTTNQ